MNNLKKKNLISVIFTIYTLASDAKPSQPIFTDEMLSKMLDSYSVSEKELIKADLSNIDQLLFRDKKPAKDRLPYYIATAGAPGSIKSTILESIIESDLRFKNAVYLDPDQRALKFMINTYVAKSLNNLTISNNKSYEKSQITAYNYWRSASNYIANTNLQKAYANFYDIAHGTTLTGPYIELLLTKLKQAGYHIILVMCGALEEVRWEGVETRTKNQCFYQTDPKDVIEKARLFPENFSIYLKYADELLIYWTAKDFQFIKAASVIDKKLTIHNSDAMHDFVQFYNPKLKTKWEELLKQNNIH